MDRESVLTDGTLPRGLETNSLSHLAACPIRPRFGRVGLLTFTDKLAGCN